MSMVTFLIKILCHRCVCALNKWRGSSFLTTQRLGACGWERETELERKNFKPLISTWTGGKTGLGNIGFKTFN